jgi:hypothetical protein
VVDSRQDGKVIFHDACNVGFDKAILYLLSLKVDVNVRNATGTLRTLSTTHIFLSVLMLHIRLTFERCTLKGNIECRGDDRSKKRGGNL